MATGWLANNNPGFPGYFGDIPLDAPTVAETFRVAGYATAAVGKWPNSTNGAAPNPTRPTYRGFDRFYGFLKGETSYFFPARIVYNNELPPHQRPPASGKRRFLPNAQSVHRSVITPLIADRNFTIVTRFRHGVADQGVLFAIGDITGGLVLYIEARVLRLTYNGFGEFHTLDGPALSAGERVATLEFEALGHRRGRGRLALDNAGNGAWGELTPTLMSGFHEGLDIGLDRRAPVDWGLRERHRVFRYGGIIHDVVIESGRFAPDSAFGKG